METYEHYELIKLIKKKIFDTHKKIVMVDGELKYEKSTSWKSDRKNLTEKQIEMLEDIDGWNLADKDYVDYKITEVLNASKTSSFPRNYSLPSVTQPSAPPSNIITPITSTNNSQITRYLCNGKKMTGQEYLFFHPGLILQKDSVILEYMIYTETPLESETVLTMKNVLNNTTTKLATIPVSQNKLLIAETKHKTEETSVVVLSMKGAKITNITLQLKVLN